MIELTSPRATRHIAKKAPPKSGETFGALINLSGRRRFTSQRIVLYAVLASMHHDHAFEKATEALGLFVDAHIRLVEGGDDLPGVFGDALPAAYFGTLNGDKQIRDFAALAQRTLDAQTMNSRQAPALLEQLIQAATPMLAVLNQFTQIYEEESKRHSQTAKKQMSELMGEIKTISKQARLVAFNAQIVAARAGHTGREFAAVASVLSDITGQMDDFIVQAVNTASQ
jgi:hypothetical protein